MMRNIVRRVRTYAILFLTVIRVCTFSTKAPLFPVADAVLRSGNHPADVCAMLENNERGDKRASPVHGDGRSVMRRVVNKYKKWQRCGSRNGCQRNVAPERQNDNPQSQRRDNRLPANWQKNAEPGGHAF